MSQISSKFIAANAVTEAKIKLSNDGYIRARNAADSADVNIIKLNSSDQIEFNSLPRTAAYTAPTADQEFAQKKYVDDSIAAKVDFADNTFRISDDVDSSKKIAFQASGITTATVRTITMSDADVDLSEIASLRTLSGTSAAANDLGTFTGSTIADTETIKGALQDLEDAVELRALDSIVIKKDGSVDFTADQSMGSNKLTNLATPTVSTDAANKAYVDSVAEGLKPKQAVRAASTANVVIASELENADVLDGVTLATGDRVLLKDQTDASENGIYVVVASGAASRSTDFDSLSPIDEVNGAYVPVQEGTANAGKFFVQTGNVSTIDTDNIDFAFFNSAASLSGGDGIDITSNIISVDLATDPGLEISGAQLRALVDPAGALERVAAGLDVKDLGIDTARLAATSVTAAKLGSDVAGNGLGGGNGSALSVNVDDVGIEISTDILQLKDSGVVTAKIAADAVDKTKIAADIAGLGLSQAVGGELDVNVDDSSIEISTDTLQVKAAGITEAMLNSAVDANTFAAVHTAVNYTPANSQIDGHLSGIDSALAAVVHPINNKESFTLDGTDITNQYIDLAQVVKASSINLIVVGGPMQIEGTDYTVSLTGGAGGNTRITFAGDLATAGNAALVAADVVVVQYEY